MKNVVLLEQWIVVATKNLTPTAIASITKEITDHYQTSLEKYEVRGISSIEAENLAVRDLGDPDKSASKFSQVYLTSYEEKKLRNMARFPYLLSAILLMLIYGSMALFSAYFSIFRFNFILNFESVYFIIFSLILFLMTILHFLDIFIIKN